jgi:hypothetical protein
LAPWRVEAVFSGGRRLIASQRRSGGTDDMQVVIAVAAAHFGATEADVLSQRRSRQMLRARDQVEKAGQVIFEGTLPDVLLTDKG